MHSKIIKTKTHNKKKLEGIIKRHPDGFGFFIPDDKTHADVYVPQHSMKSAMTNDRVTLMAEKENDGRYRGEIIKIVERSQRRVAGKFSVTTPKAANGAPPPSWGFIRDEGRGWGKDLKIPLEKSKNAREGELVEVLISKFPDEGSFEGEVLTVIGDAKNPLNDIKRVVISQNIPEFFSQETLTEAKKFNIHPNEKDFLGRKDLRHLPIVTIDGATAKDFDDAIFVETTGAGFRLFVAIADVSHYVATSTAMDKEAYERGTSVYFPNFVIPMMPEVISNGLCSLMPNVPRLALVAEMNFNFNGEMTSSSFYESIIESKARVTYGEAQELIDGVPAESEKLGQNLTHVKENILKSADLAKVLMAKRFRDGALDLEVPETVLVIDAAGEPIDVIKSERLFAHRLIEELMLAANVAVAKFLGSKEIPALYRIHEAPDPEKISNLQKYMEGLGHRTTLSGGKLQKKLTHALQEFNGKPEAQIIHILTLRSMSQAKYTPNNIGHFGLGFDFYTHFTSPIRRYPDLIVHRLLKNRITSNSRYRSLPIEDLSTAGTWLSACEQRAAKAERQIQAIKKARFMLKMVGESYDGLISSVTKFGFFVLLREFNIDGLVRLDELNQQSPLDRGKHRGQPNNKSGKSNRWEFNEENLTLTAKASGFSYKMGDVVRVTVSLVDVEQGQINFTLANTTKMTVQSVVKTTEAKAKKYAPEKHQTPEYAPRPRYTSLSDYLEQKKKGPNEEKSESKPAFGSLENRKDSKKRSTPKNNSSRVRKARPQKSSRNNKSR